MTRKEQIINNFKEMKLYKLKEISKYYIVIEDIEKVLKCENSLDDNIRYYEAKIDFQQNINHLYFEIEQINNDIKKFKI
jgi:tagatose-1,6-bisphosphate aldolase non-catalytic subunit AgaZ/GatZ